MHELMKSVDEMKMANKTLMSWLECEISKGMDCFDVKAAGEVTDMIKDLAEAEEKCIKAKYYEEMIGQLMTERYEEDGEGFGRFGYDNWRYSSGRFAPKGRGHYAGYTPMRVNAKIHDPYFSGDYRMGYPINYDETHPENYSMGYPRKNDRKSRYGYIYDEYRDARKYYTETGDAEAEKKMNEKIKEKVNDTMENMHEMWEDASPEVRKSMLSNLEGLLDEMKRMR